MNNRDNLVANGALVLAFAVLAFVMWRIAVHPAVHISAWDWPFLAIGLVALLLAGLAFARFPAKPGIALIAASSAVAMLAGAYGLVATGRDPFAIYEAKFVRDRAPAAAQGAAVTAAAPATAAWTSPRPPDTRAPAAVLAALEQAGLRPAFMYNPPPLLPLIHFGKIAPFLPLSSVSNTVTLMCQEGDQREFPVVRTDRYGLNNDDTVYARAAGEILIVGDSFAQGSCVHQEQSVAGVLRRNGYPAVSAGIGAYGPVFMLASLAEYGEILKPRTVLWFYFDGNDIVDLKDKELRSKFLLQYLQDGFSQRLAERQPEVDASWRAQGWAEAQRAFDSDAKMKEAWAATLKDPEMLALVRERLGVDVRTLTDDADLNRIFEAVLAKAKRRVESWGGRMYFVMIPNKDDYHGRIPGYRLPAIAAARKVGLPVVDVDAALRAAGDPLRFFPVRNDWGHFNPDGYAVIARQIIATLEGGETPAVTAAPPPAPAPRAAAPAAPAITGKPTGLARLEYTSEGASSKVLPADPAKATRQDGDSILGYAFTPSRPDARVRVAVSASAVAERENTFVLAVFANGEPKPVFHTSAPMEPGKRSFVQGAFELAASGVVSLDVRVGPGAPGLIRLNDTIGGTLPPRPRPYLIVREVGALAREETVPADLRFADDDRSLSYAKKVQVHEGDVVEAPMGNGRVEMNCADYLGKKDVPVFLAFGQSLASNEGQTPYQSKGEVINFNFLDSRCYRAQDPILGASNRFGSIWSRMGDEFLARTGYRAVVIASGAYGGTYLEDWMPGSRLFRRMAFALHRLKAAGAAPDAVLWQQGEAEAGMPGVPPGYYELGFLELRDALRELGAQGPIFIAQASVCGSEARNRTAIREAQAHLGKNYPDLRLGPDTDTIDASGRYDGCHLNAAGLDKAATLWAEVLAREFGGERR